MAKTRNKVPASDLKVRGFWRVNLMEEDEKVAAGHPRIKGDSGWMNNQITVEGLRLFVGNPMAAQAGSSAVARAALGAGTTAVSNTTALQSEISHQAGASSTNNRATSPTIQTASTAVGVYAINYSFLWTWFSTGNFLTATTTINNIGLFANVNSGGTLFAGATFSSSTISMNQDVQATYVIRVGI